MRTKAAQKMWPSFARPGYLNTAGPDGKRIIVPDPELGPIVTRVYEWFATGEYSLKTLAKKAYDAGFRFRKSRARIPVATLHKILRKRIYMGDFDYGGTTYEGSYEPLVSCATWERVQEILDGRHEKKHRKVTHNFPYSGMVRCGHCGCALVGEVKKGRYVYYHCTGYRGKCPERYAPGPKLQSQIAAQLRDLVVPPKVLGWLQSELLESDKTEQAAREQMDRRRQGEVNRLRARLDLLYDDRLDGRIDAEMYDTKAGAIREQIQQHQSSIRTAEVTILPAASEAVDLMTLTSRAADLFEERSAAEQRKLLHLVLKQAAWKGGGLRMSFREPFEQLRPSNSASNRNHTDSRRDESNFDIWRPTVDAFRTFLASEPSLSLPSNVSNYILIQGVNATFPLPDSSCPTRRDASRTTSARQPGRFCLDRWSSGGPAEEKEFLRAFAGFGTFARAV